ncbi:MAG: AAA family ATPase, partial [Bacteroidales bacterium]|nr:AAA family ATPase [Bacteroidales bacterium]
MVRNSEYVDKSELIAAVNRTLFTEQRFSCVSRCRRFGKSMAAKMLAAYYDCSCDSRELFADLDIAKDPTFEKHLNQYRVIYLDMTSFITRFKDESIVRHIDEELKADVCAAYPELTFVERDDLMGCLMRINDATGDSFFFIIDEWDAICREFEPGSEGMESYLNWLRRMFKDVIAYDVFAGVYMTGILPVKKYKTQSAMNNFVEYSMV